MYEEKRLTVRTYQSVAHAITKHLYTEPVQADAALHAKLLSMRDSFVNAALCVEETLEAYAKAAADEALAAVPSASPLSEAIERHLAAEPAASLETEDPPAKVRGPGQLDEATLWGK